MLVWLVMTAFEDDCAMAIEVCETLPRGFGPLVDAFAGSVFVVAEGSSRLLPLGFARFLARSWGRLNVDGSSGRLLPRKAPGQLVALSNLGRTREVLEAVRGRDYLAVCGYGESPLVVGSRASVSVLPRAEQAVASTAAVLGQTLVLAESMAIAQNRSLDRSALVAALRSLRVCAPAPGGHLWIVGSDDGLAEELSLKAWEIAAAPATPVAPGLVLHGLEEVVGSDDLIWLLDPPPDDMLRIERRLAATGARRLELSLPDIGPLQPLLRLAAGWQLFSHWARAKGRDPSVATRARKIGNEIEEKLPRE